ncbi:putative cytochrome P450 hydroxylase [Minicystis rosea]|nr:putative cytochrome P450 hydroxylase [Minicystis rosea]
MDTTPDTTAPISAVANADLRAAAFRFFTDPAARADPIPLYRRLVREAPILELGPMWLVSGFDELVGLSARHELRSTPSVRGRALPMTPIPSLAGWLALTFPMRDGADHRRLKGLAATAFSPARVAELRGRIEESIDALLAQATERGAMDVVADLALPLPVAISSAMLDVPAGDREQVHAWAMLVRRQLLRYDQSADEIARIEAEMEQFAAFVHALCDERRRRPGNDLLSDLSVAADAGRLSRDELVAFVLLLFVNGLETLTSGLTMAVWELLQHPEERLAIAGNRAYAEAMFDEVLRLHCPVRFSARVLVGDVQLDGHRLREGDVVTLCFGAANRDPRRFVDPDRFDPRRPRSRHLGFGHGAHYCLGAQLSLTTGACVLERIAKHGDRLTTRVTPATAAWSRSLAFTTLDTLPIEIAPPARTT